MIRWIDFICKIHGMYMRSNVKIFETNIDKPMFNILLNCKASFTTYFCITVSDSADNAKALPDGHFRHLRK